MKKFCESLREQAVKMINFLKMKLLTKELQKSFQNAKICYICKEKFKGCVCYIFVSLFCISKREHL